MRFLEEEAFTFDDVLLVPQYSDIESRKDVNISTKLGPMAMSIPIISANMDSVTGPEMAKAMIDLGGYGYIHRFATKEQRLLWASQGFAITVGVGEKELDFAKECYEKLGFCHYLVDIAHGDSKHCHNMVASITKLGKGIIVCAGNVCTQDGAGRLIQAGAKIIKAGVGPGAVCTTRSVTGHGFPQLSCILDVANETRPHGITLIADGGIRTSGDIAKAIAAGADAVMLGSILAGCDEAPGERIQTDKGIMKTYRGMAAKSSYDDNPNRTSKHPTPEGIDGLVSTKGPVSGVIEQLTGGLRSAMSYSGARTLKEFRQKAVFVRVSSGTAVETSTRV